MLININTLLKKLNNTNDKKIALNLLLITFVLRAIYGIIYYYINYPPESYLYYRVAELILEQGKIFYNTINDYQNVVGPVLPWLNAFTMLIFGQNYLGLYIVSALGSSLVTFYTYKTARLFLNKKISLFIGIWSTFYLFYYYVVPSPGKDIWMSFFTIFLIYNIILMYFKGNFTIYNFIWFTITYTISFHLDERFFMFFPILIIFILWYETKGFKKYRVKFTLIFIILTLVLMTPWTIRNYIKYNKIVLISTRTQLLTDKILGYPETKLPILDFMDPYGRYYIKDAQIDSIISGKKNYTDGGHKISTKQIEAMKRGKLPHFLSPWERYWINAKKLLRPMQFVKGEYTKTGYCYYEQSLRNRISQFLFYGLMFIFSFPGFYFIYLTNRRIFWLFLFIVLIWLLIHTFFVPFTNWRYRLPLDAIFIIVGCYGIVELYMKIRSK